MYVKLFLLLFFGCRNSRIILLFFFFYNLLAVNFKFSAYASLRIMLRGHASFHTCLDIFFRAKQIYNFAYSGIICFRI